MSEPVEDNEPCEECEAGAPAWLATFADLMSLLMCFFVLLLSFSEIDVQKYKQVAGSLKFAFGVQRDIEAEQIPKAESVIKEEFRPGKPEPTVIETVRQQTREELSQVPRSNENVQGALGELVEAIEERLQKELDDDALELVVKEDGVMIRVNERDAFPSGSAELQPGFVPVLDKLVTVLDDFRGNIVVSGHTDSVPIATRAYPSNWVLSSARAASVVHELADNQLSDPSRIEIRAYADTRPIADGSSPEGRARNRRVEIDVTLDADER